MGLTRIIFALALTAVISTLDNGVMRTPPMGWLAWERFRCDIDCNNDPKNCISEQLFMDMADRLAEDGWRELGYVYVNIDDCWSSMQRDQQGRLQPDPKRFPGGIPKLAQYIHDRGLRLGIYGDLGTHTCMGYPGTTLDKIETDAQTFADWGIDMLKLDGCYSDATLQEKGYPLMAKALNATGRSIGYSCSWPAYQGGLPPKVNYTELGEICNLWRNYDDIQDSWDSVLNIVDWFSNHQDVLQPFAGPGHWNDPDMVCQPASLYKAKKCLRFKEMAWLTTQEEEPLACLGQVSAAERWHVICAVNNQLLIGDFGLSEDESRTQMALWAIMAAPLFMSNDLRTLSSSARKILQNKAAIVINQDKMGVQGRRLLKEKSGIEVFWRPLSNSASALVFFSRRTDMPFRYTNSLGKLNYTAGRYLVYDVFEEKWMPGLRDTTDFTISINPTGVVMWYLGPTVLKGQSWMWASKYPNVSWKHQASLL